MPIFSFARDDHLHSSVNQHLLIFNLARFRIPVKEGNCLYLIFPISINLDLEI